MQNTLKKENRFQAMSAVATAYAQPASALPIELCAPVRRIVTFHSGSLREFVFALPALKALRETFDGAHLCVVLREGLAALLEGNALVDEILLRPVGGLSAQAGLMAKLHAHHFDMALTFSTSRKSTLLAWSSGAPLRIGFDGAKMDALLTHRVTKEEDLPLSIESMLDLTRAVGCAPRCLDYTKMLRPAPKFEKESAQILQEKQISGPFLLVAPQAEDSRPARPDQSASLWSTVLAELATHHPIVLVGPRTNRALLRKVNEKAALPILHDLAGEMELPVLAALCEAAQLFIGHAGGTAHLAAAMNTPGVIICPDQTPRDVCRPRGVTHRLLKENADRDELLQATRELIGL